MNDTCQICLGNKRSIKFNTERVKICQWCVSTILDVNIDPDEIKNHLMNIIKDNIPKPPIEPKKIHSRETAIAIADGESSLTKYIFNNTFNRNAYNKKIEEMTDKIYSKKLAEYKNELEIYNNNLKNRIIENYNKLLTGEYVPEGIAYTKHTKYSSYDYMGSMLKSIDNKHIKYMRAHNIHLLSGMDKSNRLNEDEMKTIKDRIKSEDNFKCMICSKEGKDVELHVHHIIPLVNYGNNHTNNLVTLCYSCHNRQHPDITVSQYKKKNNHISNGEINQRRNIIEVNDGFSNCFIAVDIETTGFRSDDKIIEISAVKFGSLILTESFTKLVNPNRPIPSKVTDLTGISNNTVKDSPVIDVVLPDFIKYTNGHVLVFHNHSFDLRFIEKEAKRLGYSIDNKIVDTLPLARKAIPDLPNHKLSTLVEYFELKQQQNHRALDDSISTGLVLIELVKIMGYRFN
jgi:DNA polymerase III epsilon subunit family exonuclease